MREIILGKDDISEILPKRKKNVHKGSVGKVLVIAGSRGLSGAALLSSSAVLRAGAGLVTLATPNYIADLIDVSNREVMTFPLIETPVGSISKKSFDLLAAILARFDTLLIGPGLSRNKSTIELIRDLLMYISKEHNYLKVVVDADALRVMKTIVRPLKMPIIITPHLGELAYLLERTTVEIGEKPYYYAKQAAKKFGTVVVLKSHYTFIAEPNSPDYFVNINGNPGMATAGSGDVLAGLLTGILAANNISPIKAAVAAPFIHAYAANIAVKERSLDGIIASDILENIPAALRSIKGQ